MIAFCRKGVMNICKYVRLFVLQVSHLVQSNQA